MNDVRKKAEEKAKQRIEEQSQQKDPSRRQKEKQDLRNEINRYTGENVTKIAARKEKKTDKRKLRVAGYGRVSTDDVGQVISMEMQKQEFSKKIRENPNWEYYGIYIDDGFSGTNTAHRPGFRRMMEDAMAGKFDAIITKSVSRFARNLLDCIGWVRRLQEQDPPVAVIFEDVGLNTLDKTSNLILFVLAMVAEEESHMKSEAMLISLEWRFSRGRFLIPSLLGYESIKGEDGMRTLQVIPEEADTVRLMYYMLLNGNSPEQIAATLTEMKRRTGGGHTKWTDSGVISTLRNERYCGDVLARKTWTPNFRDHKSKKNNGKKNKYYQPAHHEAIVSRAQWNAAQKILNSRRFGHDSGYLPMKVIDHGALTGYVSINRSWAGYEPDDYYRASSMVMGLMEGDPNFDLENEHLPDEGRPLAGLSDEGGIQRIARELSEAEKKVQAQMEGHDDSQEQEKKKMPTGFQVASGSMFSHVREPVVRFTERSISFSTTCIEKLDRHAAATIVERCAYAEILLNPVERMLVIRPSTESHPNAIRWDLGDGKGISLGATAFCRDLFSLMGWDREYAYQVAAVLRRKDDEAALFFDLDNYIGKAIGKKNKNEDEPEEDLPAEKYTGQILEQAGRSVFFAADDEPEEIERTKEMEEEMARERLIEQRTFGTPTFEHNGQIRLSAIDDDGEWDIMASPIQLDEEHSVSLEVFDELKSRMKKEG